MTIFKRSFLITLLALLSITTSFTAGYFVRSTLQSRQEQFPVLKEAYTILADNALNPLPTKPAMEYGMVRGMLQAYGDPHTSFLEPVQNQLESDALSGKYGGIGVSLGSDAEGNRVLFPFPDSPASQAGIKEGDRLLAVGDLEINKDTPTQAIQAAIRGPVDQIVAITIARAPDYAPFHVSIKRKEIPLPSVTWHLEPAEPRLGIFEVNIIAATTPDEIQKAIKDLGARGATHFVMDLRNNGGGLLDAGIKIARLFLTDGMIIQQQYRGREIESFKVETPGPLVTIPLVILVNENTASASEIIAGSLQAHKRSALIGTDTYGKNTIQLVFTLQDKSSLHVTAARWWIPGLDFPKDGHGLEPEYRLPEGSNDPQEAIRTAIQIFFQSGSHFSLFPVR